MEFREYQNRKEQARKKLTNIKKILEEMLEVKEINNNSREYILEIGKMLYNIDAEELKIVLCGQYSSGKTTFLKTLLNFKQLPTEMRENSSALVYFHKATDTHPDKTIEANLFVEKSIKIEITQIDDLKIFIEKKNDFKPGDEADKQDKTIDVLKKYFEEPTLEYIKENGWETSKYVQSVHIWLLNDVLNEGITIVDTPGIGSITERHEDITVNEVRDAYAVVYLFDALQYLDKTDYSFLRRISGLLDNSLFVLNKADYLFTDKANDNKIEEIKKQIKDSLHGEAIEINSEYLEHCSIKYHNICKKDLSEIKDSEKELNSTYKDKKLEELHNFETVKRKIYERIAYALNRKIEDRIKIDYLKYADEILDNVRRDLENMREVYNYNDNETEIKISKITNKINDLERESKSINEIFNKQDNIIEEVKKEIEQTKTDCIEETEKIFEEIKNMNDGDYKNQEWKKPYSNIKKKIDDNVAKLSISINSHIKDYISDFLNTRRGNEERQVESLFTVSYNEDVFGKIIIDKGVSDTYDKNIEELKDVIDAKKKEIEKKFQDQTINQKQLDYINGKVQRLNDYIAEIQKEKMELGSRPAPIIIDRVTTYVAETRRFTGNPKRINTYTEHISDDTPGTAYDKEKEMMHTMETENKKLIEDEMQRAAEKELVIVDIKNQIEELTSHIRNIDTEIIKILNDKNKKTEELEKSKISEDKKRMYNSTIGTAIEMLNSLDNNIKERIAKIIKDTSDNIASGLNNLIEELKAEKNNYQGIIKKDKDERTCILEKIGNYINNINNLEYRR